MPKNTVWIGESNPEEQGSFCDRDSGHQFINGNIFEASRQEDNALERGDKVLWLDAPVDQRDVYEVPENQRFNIYLSESDSQGVNSPSKYGPGR
jgi:hypothetical protein